jgi:hypothetical protein
VNQVEESVDHWAFDAGEGVILCCSSTRHRRFIDDLLNVMALPLGARIRLRYGKEVCDPRIRKEGERESISRVDDAVLVVHVKFVGLTPEFLPLRAGRAIEIQTHGTVTYLEVELGEFVEQPEGTSFAAVLSQLAQLELPRIAPGQEKPDAYFCQKLVSAPVLRAGSDSDLWERVAERFLAAIDKSDADFPFVFQFEVLRVGRSGAKAVAMRDGMLHLWAISKFEIRIRTLAKKVPLSIIQSPVGELQIKVDHPECRLGSRSSLPIDTSRNLLTPRMTTTLGSRPAYGVLSITAHRGESVLSTTSSTQSSQQVAGPIPVDEVVVELPVAVGRPWIRVLAAMSIALAAAAHEFELKEIDHNFEGVCLKAGIVFVLVFGALVLGLKPQAGG